MVPIAASDLTDEDRAELSQIAANAAHARSVLEGCQLREENLRLRIQLRKLTPPVDAPADADLPKAAEGTE